VTLPLKEADEVGLGIGGLSLRPRAGLAAQRRERPLEELLAVGQHQQAVAVVGRLLDLVGRVDDGGAGFRERRDELPELDALGRIEPGARLVE
jgi:hypothetical protein